MGKKQKQEEVVSEEVLENKETVTEEARVDKKGVEMEVEEKGVKTTELEELMDELNQAKDKYLRLFAEFDNYKKRTIKESLDLRKSASRAIIEALLPVVDDFHRAKKSAEDENTKETFSEGVELVYNKLQSVLANKGLKPMDSTGKEFDPELHEALTEIPAPSEELKGKVVDTIESGYFLNEKIIRHAKVIVGK